MSERRTCAGGVIPALIILLGAVPVGPGCSGGNAHPDLPDDTGTSDLDTGVLVPCQGPEDCKNVPVGTCQLAVCSVTDGHCIAVADELKEGSHCDPDDPCAAQPKICDGGECVYTVLKDCEEKPCKKATGCDPQTGDCLYEELPEGAGCPSADPCLDGTCTDGTCLFTPGCTDGDPCTEDFCAAETGDCSFPPVDCDDDNSCTTDTCDPTLGCTNTAEVGKGCDDGDLCTGTDLCDASGTCNGKDPKDCGDGNPCTNDSCDPQTGQCSHQANTAPCDDGDPCTGEDACADKLCEAGLPVPGCCHGDPDCDDADPCTEESCVEGNCWSGGEPEGTSGTGCVPGSACQSGFCDPVTGTCETFSLTMPRVLLDWDLSQGFPPAGFRWTAGVGQFGPHSVETVGAGPASFRLPAHYAPAGIHVLQVTLVEGQSCLEASDVSVDVGGVQYAPSGCALEEGAPVLPFSWIIPAAQKVDVEITVQPGGTVSRMTLFAWAASGCRPLGPVAVAEGTDLTDLALAGTRRGLMAGYRKAARSWSVAHDLRAGPFAPQVLDTSDYSIVQGRYSTSLVSLTDGRYLLAYGGADQQVRLVLLDGHGIPMSGAVPDLYVPGPDLQYEPCLYRAEQGLVRLAYSSSLADDDGLGIATTTVQVTGDQLGPFTTVQSFNQATTGDQGQPVLWKEWALGEGLVAWISSTPDGPKVTARRMTFDGAPLGDEVTVAVGTPGTTFPRLSNAHAGDRHFIAWQTSGGQVQGVVLDGDLSKTADLDLSGVGTEQYHPTLVGHGDGVLLVLTRVDGLDVNVVQARVGEDGGITGVQPLSGQVKEPTATPSAASCGPFMDCLGFVDTWTAADKGVYLGLTSEDCALGPVDCTQPVAPGVCVGFGATGYLVFPGATGWCP